MAWTFCSAFILEPACANDVKPAPEPVYKGSCENDIKHLDEHFEFWNGGRHGPDPMHCRFAVDALIFHQEAAYYMDLPKRCQINGRTPMGFNGSQYMPHFSNFASDAEMRSALTRAVQHLRGVTCSPTPQQSKELERQARRQAQ